MTESLEVLAHVRTYHDPGVGVERRNIFSCSCGEDRGPKRREFSDVYLSCL